MRKWITAVALLLIGGTANAGLMIDVSDVDITKGSYYGLTWRTSERSDFSFYLGSGMQTVTYGYFHTRDFSINFWDAIDKDKIKTKMTLNPPGTRVQSKGKVSANARFFWYRESITIDFDNSWHNLGAYKMRFNDAKMYRNGTVALTAKFMRLPKPVSEPSSLALVLVGALGLLLARRLRA